MTALAFEYFEIRPCIDLNGAFISYQTEAAFNEDRQKLDAKGTTYKVLWTLYGRYQDDIGQFLAMAIGDFNTKNDAFQIMNAILAPMAKARDGLVEALRLIYPKAAVADVSCRLDDFINQSSDRERL